MNAVLLALVATLVPLATLLVSALRPAQSFPGQLARPADAPSGPVAVNGPQAPG